MQRHKVVTYCEQEEPERPAFVPSFTAAFQFSYEFHKGVSEMEQRDWELLNKHLYGHQTKLNDGLAVSSVVAVFIAGLILGGLMVPHESQLMGIATNDARTVI